MFAQRRKKQDIFYVMGQEKIIGHVGHFCTYIPFHMGQKKQQRK